MSRESIIQLKLFANLQTFTPPAADSYPIEAGITVGDLLAQLDIPEDKIKLIFIDGVKSELATVLRGGERVGIFPPVGGG
ncbi:MAG: MoaD/ThiS family protein [Desulfobacterales bacterium]|jgi:molybdopterin converting factor small subunit